MASFVLLFVCLAIGMTVARSGRAPDTLAPSLNWWVMNIAMPSLVLELIPTVHLDWRLWYLPVSQWVLFVGAWALVAFAGSALKWPRKRIGAITLVAGLANTSFIGYPMVEAMRGREGLALAVVADQVGAVLSLAVGGVIVASVYSGGKPEPKEIVKRLLFFPPFMALVVALVSGRIGPMPTVVTDILHRIGQTLTPLALFSIGLRFRLSLDRSELGALSIGLLWKLALAPLAVALLGRALGVAALTLDVSTLQVAMAPMTSAWILAERHDLEPRLASATLGVGILVSLGTIPLWSQLLALL